MRLDMEKIKLDGLKAEFRKLKAQLAKVQDQLDNDPMDELIAVQADFSKFLKTYQGDARLTQEADNIVKSLRERELKAKAASMNFDLIKLLDRQTELQSQVDQLKTEINNMEFREKLKERS